MQRLRAVVGVTCRVRAAARLQIGLAGGLRTAGVLRVRAAIELTHQIRAAFRGIHM